jgi:hypothetical protein
MAQNAIGPNFSNEVAAAGLAGLPFSWGSDGLHDTSQLTAAQLTSLEAVLAAHNPAKVPPSQSYAAALAAGCQIVSTSTPTLNGTYALDPQTLSNVTSEQVYIATAGKFTNGQTTRAWADATGAFHVFPSPTSFTTFAEAIAQYVDSLSAALATAEAGGAWSAPPMPSPIP